MPPPKISRRLRLSGLLQELLGVSHNESAVNDEYQVSIRLPPALLQSFQSRREIVTDRGKQDDLIENEEFESNKETSGSLAETLIAGKITEKEDTPSERGNSHDKAEGEDKGTEGETNDEKKLTSCVKPDSEVIRPISHVSEQVSEPTSGDSVQNSSDSDLSSLDEELNNVLTAQTLATSPLGKNVSQVDVEAISDEIEESDDDILQQTDVPILPPQAPGLMPQGGFRTRVQRAGNSANNKYSLEVIKPKIEPGTEASSEELKGYRRIPQPYLSLMKRELSLFTDLNNEEDLSMIQKVIFSLKDPYSGTKIQLPIKSTTCKHFECFDFKTFCQINQSKISAVDQVKLRKELCSRNFEARKLEKLFQEQMKKFGTSLNRIQVPNGKGQPPLYTYPQYSENGQIFHFALYNRTPPLFKCPICDQLFGIKQLYISDVFNYFVKVTPKTVERIELLDMARYRIIDNNPIKSSASPGLSEKEEVIVLSDDSSDEDIKVNNRKKPKKVFSSESEDDFNDGLDDMLMSLSKPEEGSGMGSWDDPVTLDD